MADPEMQPGAANRPELQNRARIGSRLPAPVDEPPEEPHGPSGLGIVSRVPRREAANIERND